MIPLLAPLLGSLAGSLLPATLGSGIAGALGLKGAAGALVASAAPKAIGAGIGTLLAGGDLGDAALNAVGFGAGGALLGGAGSTGAPATSPRPTMRPNSILSSMPAPSVVPTAGGGGANLAVSPPLQMAAAPATVPAVGGPSVVPAAVGIGTIPIQGQSPMSNDIMLAGVSPNQSNMVNRYLRSRNMVGFA